MYYSSIIILTKLTALAVHYAITILLPRPRNKRELQVYYGLVVCTHRVAHWFKLLSKEAFLFSWSCTIHIIFAPSLQSLLVMRQLTTRIGILFVPKLHILICNSYRVTRLGLSQGLKIRMGGGLEPPACNIPADKKELPVKNKYAKCLKKQPNLKYCLNLGPKIYVSAMKNFISCTRPEHSAYRGSPTYTVSTSTVFGLCTCKWGN